MIVNLHIERLVLDGLPVGSHEGPLVRAAVEAELARLIGEGEGVRGLKHSRSEPVVRVEPIPRPAASNSEIGALIGRAVYGGIVR